MLTFLVPNVFIHFFDTLSDNYNFNQKDVLVITTYDQFCCMISIHVFIQIVFLL